MSQDHPTSNVEVALTDLERYCSGSASALHSIAVVDAEIERLELRCAALLEAECDKCPAVTERDRLRAALEPFAKLHEARTTIYQKRGGNLDSFPDSHPAYYITASQLRLGIWRRAAEAYIGGSSDETAGEPMRHAVECKCGKKFLTLEVGLDHVEHCQGERTDGWQPMDTAPTDGTSVLLCWPYWAGTTPCIGEFDGSGWNSNVVLSDAGVGPLWWRPLPKAPQESAVKAGDESK